MRKDQDIRKTIAKEIYLSCKCDTRSKQRQHCSRPAVSLSYCLPVCQTFTHSLMHSFVISFIHSGIALVESVEAWFEPRKYISLVNFLNSSKNKKQPHTPPRRLFPQLLHELTCTPCTSATCHLPLATLVCASTLPLLPCLSSRQMLKCGAAVRTP